MCNLCAKRLPRCENTKCKCIRNLSISRNLFSVDSYSGLLVQFPLSCPGARVVPTDEGSLCGITAVLRRPKAVGSSRGSYCFIE
jgi:hypothetical protein